MENSPTPSKWEILVSKATIYIAVATVINVLVAAYTGYKTSEYTKITNKIYESSNRPYVGIFSITPTKLEDRRKIHINIQSKNFGNVPASSARLRFVAQLDGYGKPDIKNRSYDLYCNIFPQNTYDYGMFMSSNYTEITSGKSVFELLITITYKGVDDKPYKDYERWRYDSESNSFYPIEANTN